MIELSIDARPGRKAAGIRTGGTALKSAFEMDNPWLESAVTLAMWSALNELVDEPTITPEAITRRVQSCLCQKPVRTLNGLTRVPTSAVNAILARQDLADLCECAMADR